MESVENRVYEKLSGLVDSMDASGSHDPSSQFTQLLAGDPNTQASVPFNIAQSTSQPNPNAAAWQALVDLNNSLRRDYRAATRRAITAETSLRTCQAALTSAQADIAQERSRADVERARADNERARADQERIRADSQAVRADSEKMRADAEKARADSEKARADAQTNRANAEQTRANGEKTRADREQARADQAVSSISHFQADIVRLTAELAGMPPFPLLSPAPACLIR